MLELSTRDRCFVIAEAGTSHIHWDYAKRLEKALRYVEAAGKAGADAIKFQWFKTPIAAADGGDMFCWIEGDEARCASWAMSEMGLDRWRQVKEFAEACGLVFLASAFQTSTVQWLIDLKLEATKVASRAARNFPYDVEGLPKPLLISDGMLDRWPDGELDAFWLQCEAKYPSTKAWEGLGGFSDHSGRPFLGLDAIAHGCKVLEVHFAINSIDAGPNLPACLTLDELKLLCKARDYYAGRRLA